MRALLELRVAVRGLLTGVASLVVGLGLQDEQSSGVAVPPPWGTGSVVEPVEYVGSSWTRDQTQTCVSCIDRIFFFFFTNEPPGKPCLVNF